MVPVKIIKTSSADFNQTSADFEPIPMPEYNSSNGSRKKSSKVITGSYESDIGLYIVIVIVLIVLIVLTIMYWGNDTKMNFTPIQQDISPTGKPEPLPELSRITPGMRGTKKLYPPMIGKDTRYDIWTAYNSRLSPRNGEGLIHEEINTYQPVRSGYHPRDWETPYYPPQHLYRNTYQTIDVVYPTEHKEREMALLPVGCHKKIST
jgi:hypothetical protein